MILYLLKKKTNHKTKNLYSNKACKVKNVFVLPLEIKHPIAVNMAGDCSMTANTIILNLEICS